ncbi:1-deoxy-D-xylulose-5-phosphate reductoisomerase [Thalassospira sp. MCCC 1A01428]|uniref:1-deoxy-D-xylulose-5-phosphate reductoisomerase n=1 Tax=Thalassospira sp. MCCC 1A01428 TaxID=1470575 RepID=UPI000A1E9607|nr:1-deoxy-D-xylulose-5-phosphate reductoisomerase [Thalassospira sp. MCCC 1A01428]OSQ42430.1 1-deoxy-D-xylulose 5-phosphate reductoisomerase [Thalassospira sp. MCCC 1A01428]
MSVTKSVCIMGVTGSIGKSTADVVLAHPDRYRVDAVTAHRNVDELASMAIKLGARFAVIADEALFNDLKVALAGSGIEAGAGENALIEAACRPSDIVIAGIVGAAGLRATLAAVRRGAVIGLANKETLVCAGELMTDEVRRYNATIIPVDSEHSAIFQVLDDRAPDRIERILLTASGGPFRTWSLSDMAAVSREQALAHPNWSMGAKISIDSATMMNKGLELIEACRLFPVAESKVEILVHPQSVIHSMVEYVDGSVLAQLGTPDMRTPIAYALGWPERLPLALPRLDFAAIGQFSFEAPDEERFPALRLAREALRAGGTLPIVLNAANEVAVAAFLAGRIGFLDITKLVEAVMVAHAGEKLSDIDHVFATDDLARRLTKDMIERLCL